jgi:CDP-diacylglycerol---serine O-phosphatidyltransferase
MMTSDIPSWREQMTFPDLLTLLNGACGVLSIMASIKGNFSLAACLMLAGVLWDGLDGKIARFLHQEGRLGKDLDSLCDAITFGVAPAVFGFMQMRETPLNFIFLVLFVLGGILRLARFNVLSLHHFVGMPITMNGLWVPLAYFCGLFSQPWIIGLYVASFVLMVSSFRIPKL